MYICICVGCSAAWRARRGLVERVPASRDSISNNNDDNNNDNNNNNNHHNSNNINNDIVIIITIIIIIIIIILPSVTIAIVAINIILR